MTGFGNIGLKLNPKQRRNPLTLFLDFMTGVLDSRIVASGGANATRTNAAGVLVTATTPRFDYDPVTLLLNGLLVEEGRTNLFLSALLNGTSLGTQTVTVTAVPYTISFYGTGTITLSGAATAVITGTGVYPARVTSTFTPAAGPLVCTVVGSVQYAQIELGGYGTSFIPTAGATVARTFDSVEMPFGTWRNAGEGTYLTAFRIGAQEQFVYRAILGFSPSRFIQIDGSGSFYNALVGALGPNDANSANATNSNAINKVIGAYNSSLPTIVCLNGGIVAKNTQDWQSVQTKFVIGAYANYASFLNGHIRSVAYYNVLKSDAEMQTLTT